MKTLRSILYAKRVALCLAILLSLASAAQADHYQTTVEVGKTKTRSLRRSPRSGPAANS